MQARVDGAEHHHALLDQCQRGTDRGVGVLVAQLFERGLHHTLARVHQKAEQLEQRGARAVERQGHGQLANVVDKRAAFELDHLGGLQVDGLSARAALEFEQRGDVLNVRRVQQRTQRAGRSARQAADHVGQANRVRAAPGHKRELDNPVQLLAALVEQFPIAVQTNRLAGRLVDADDVRLHAVTKIEVRVNLKDRAQAVLVVGRLFAALDLVVGLACGAELHVAWRAQVNVDVHARLDAAIELGLGDVLNVRLALGAVKVGRGKRQVNVVDGNELGGGALPLRRPHQLEVLAAAQGQLRRQLLELATELGHLLGGLPVHELRLAACLVQLLGIDLPQHLGLDRAARREYFFHEAGTEIHAGLDQHGVHHLVGTSELSATGSVVAEARAAQAFFVQLVALLPCLFVLADFVEQVGDGVVKHSLIDLVDDVGEVGLLVLGVLRVFQSDDCAAVLCVFDVHVLSVNAEGLAHLGLVFCQVIVSHVFRLCQTVFIA